jgi:hypothetical protein
MFDDKAEELLCGSRIYNFHIEPQSQLSVRRPVIDQ